MAAIPIAATTTPESANSGTEVEDEEVRLKEKAALNGPWWVMSVPIRSQSGARYLISFSLNLLFKPLNLGFPFPGTIVQSTVDARNPEDQGREIPHGEPQDSDWCAHPEDRQSRDGEYQTDSDFGLHDFTESPDHDRGTKE